MEYELRIYRVQAGRMAEFVELFRQVADARRAHGFEVLGPWITDDDGFIWITGYGGEDGFEAAVKRYYDSPERKAIQPEPASLLESMETRMMRPV